MTAKAMQPEPCGACAHDEAKHHHGTCFGSAFCPCGGYWPESQRKKETLSTHRDAPSGDNTGVADAARRAGSGDNPDPNPTAPSHRRDEVTDALPSDRALLEFLFEEWAAHEHDPETREERFRLDFDTEWCVGGFRVGIAAKMPEYDRLAARASVSPKPTDADALLLRELLLTDSPLSDEQRAALGRVVLRQSAQRVSPKETTRSGLWECPKYGNQCGGPWCPAEKEHVWPHKASPEDAQTVAPCGLESAFDLRCTLPKGHDGAHLMQRAAGAPSEDGTDAPPYRELGGGWYAYVREDGMLGVMHKSAEHCEESVLPFPRPIRMTTGHGPSDG